MIMISSQAFLLKIFLHEWVHQIAQKKCELIKKYRQDASSTRRGLTLGLASRGAQQRPSDRLLFGGYRFKKKQA